METKVERERRPLHLATSSSGLNSQLKKSLLPITLKVGRVIVFLSTQFASCTAQHLPQFVIILFAYLFLMSSH